MLGKLPFSPAQPRRLLHPPALSLPRQPLSPETRRSAGKAAASNQRSSSTLARLRYPKDGPESPPLRASNEGLLRPRVARAQGTHRAIPPPAGGLCQQPVSRSCIGIVCWPRKHRHGTCRQRPCQGESSRGQTWSAGLLFPDSPQ